MLHHVFSPSSKAHVNSGALCALLSVLFFNVHCVLSLPVTFSDYGLVKEFIVVVKHRAHCVNLIQLQVCPLPQLLYTLKEI